MIQPTGHSDQPSPYWRRSFGNHCRRRRIAMPYLQLRPRARVDKSFGSVQVLQAGLGRSRPEPGVISFPGRRVPHLAPAARPGRDHVVRRRAYVNPHCATKNRARFGRSGFNPNDTSLAIIFGETRALADYFRRIGGMVRLTQLTQSGDSRTESEKTLSYSPYSMFQYGSWNSPIPNRIHLPSYLS